jgi:hypothetical protein
MNGPRGDITVSGTCPPSVRKYGPGRIARNHDGARG